ACSVVISHQHRRNKANSAGYSEWCAFRSSSRVQPLIVSFHFWNINMSETALRLMLASLLQTQGAGAIPESPIVSEMVGLAAPIAPKKEPHWFGRIGILGALYNSGATIAAGGNVIPGASARVTNNVTVTFDLGYDITDNLAVMFTAGVPPRPEVIGEG